MTYIYENSEEFKRELKELLKKHNATISFGCGDCSDTYGLYEERIEVSFNKPGTFQSQDLKLSDGWGVSASDLED